MQVKGRTIDPTGYNIVGGTWYKGETDPEVIRVLESARLADRRLIILYGDVATGRAWNDAGDPIRASGAVGYVGRSMGPIKIPLEIYNRRCYGGSGLLESCILYIAYANKRDGAAPLYNRLKTWANGEPVPADFDPRTLPHS